MTLHIKTYCSIRGDELRYGVLTPTQNADFRQEWSERRKPLVFFPGLGGSVKNALVFFNALLPVASPIYVPDLRGFGLNEACKLPDPIHFVAEARHFINSVVLANESTPLWVGGISLGAALATRLFEWPELREHASKLLLVAPAYREHPNTFPLSVVGKTALDVMLKGPDSLVRLPYGLDDLTRNEAILTDPRHQEQMENFMLPISFAWQLRQFNRGAVKQLSNISIPSCVVVPEQDTVCCPKAMVKASRRLGKKHDATLLTYPQARHDIFLEPEVLMLADDVSQWLLT